MEHLIIAEQLKQRTLFHHQQLEKIIVGKIRSMYDIDDYIALLQYFYSYFGGLEDQIPVELVLPLLDDYSTRRKTPDLQHDILCCGGAIPQKPPKEYLPEIKNAIQAMGVLYVIEGSSLGGQIISKMIAKQLNFTSNECLSYFLGYKAQTESMWMRFKQSINDIPAEKAPELIDAANETFERFKKWIEDNGR